MWTRAQGIWFIRRRPAIQQCNSGGRRLYQLLEAKAEEPWLVPAVCSAENQQPLFNLQVPLKVAGAWFDEYFNEIKILAGFHLSGSEKRSWTERLCWPLTVWKQTNSRLIDSFQQVRVQSESFRVLLILLFRFQWRNALHLSFCLCLSTLLLIFSPHTYSALPHQTLYRSICSLILILMPATRCDWSSWRPLENKGLVVHKQRRGEVHHFVKHVIV